MFINSFIKCMDDADIPDEDTVKQVDALAAIVVVFVVPLFCKLDYWGTS